MKKEDKEIWFPIPGYEDLYECSTHSRIRSMPRIVKSRYGTNYIRPPRLLKVQTSTTGYKVVSLTQKDGQIKQYKVHRFIAMHFIPNPENKPYIDHINTIRTDNRIENLRWVTHKENCNNIISKKKMSKGTKKSMAKRLDSRIRLNSKKKERPVVQLTLDGKFVNQYKSVREAERAFNTGGGAISCCCRNIKGFESSCGYKWMYKEDYEKLKK